MQSQRLSRTVELKGHLIDNHILTQVLDTLSDLNVDATVEQFEPGIAKGSESQITFTITADNETQLESAVESIQSFLSKAPLHPASPKFIEKQWRTSPLNQDGRPKILMCPPDFFEVSYAINPWMDTENPPSAELAKTQWNQLKATIESTGAEVFVMDAQPGLPDIVFTANAAVVLGDQAIIAHYKHAERQGEEPHCVEWFSNHGFTVTELPRNVYYEGAGDALRNGRYFAGYKTRTDIASHNILSRITGVPVVSLELTKPAFYHVDVCLCPLENGDLLYYPNAFTPAGLEILEANVPKANRITVTDEEAKHFACNAISIKNHLILNQGAVDASTGFVDELNRRGVQVHGVNLSEFIKAGGSAKCLTLRLQP